MDEFLTAASKECKEHWLSFVGPKQPRSSPVTFEDKVVGLVEWVSDDHGDQTHEHYVQVIDQDEQLIERMLQSGRFKRSRRLPDRWRHNRHKEGMKGMSARGYLKRVRSDEVSEAMADDPEFSAAVQRAKQNAHVSGRPQWIVRHNLQSYPEAHSHPSHPKFMLLYHHPEESPHDPYLLKPEAADELRQHMASKKRETGYAKVSKDGKLHLFGDFRTNKHTTNYDIENSILA